MVETKKAQYQIRGSDNYDASESVSENKGTLEQDQNALRAQIKKILGTANWIDEPPINLTSLVSKLVGALDYQGTYDASTNTPDLETPAGGTVEKGMVWIVSVAGTFYTENLEVGDMLIAEVDDPSSLSDWARLQFNIKTLDDIADGTTYVKITSVKEQYIDQDVTDGSSPNFTSPSVTSIKLDTSNDSSPSPGEINFSNSRGYMQIGMPGGNVVIQLGQEIVTRVYNNTGSQINNGQAVYLSGVEISNGEPAIALAKADSLATSQDFWGLATENIPDGSFGYVTREGLVNDVDTSSFSVDDELYLSPTTAGSYINSEPSPPNYVVHLGKIIESNASTGKILLHRKTIPNLGDLADIDLTGLLDGQTLVYNATSEKWEPGSAITDIDAIHDNQANEITAITEKTTVENDDEFIIEDSSDTYNKKSVKRSNVVKNLTETQYQKTSPALGTEGRQHYSSSSNLHRTENDLGLVVDIGANYVRRVVNNTGVQIDKGTPVCSIGVSGGLHQIAKAIADSPSNVRFMLGLTADDIPNGNEGWVIDRGRIEGLDTSGFSVNDIIYVSPTTAGTLTNLQPRIYSSQGKVLVSDALNGVIDVTNQQASSGLQKLFDITDSLKRIISGAPQDDFIIDTSNSVVRYEIYATSGGTHVARMTFQMEIPIGFEGFGNNSVAVTTFYTAGETPNSMSLYMLKGGVADSTINGVSVLPSVGDSYENFQFTPGSSYSSGDIILFEIEVSVDNSESGSLSTLDVYMQGI